MSTIGHKSHLSLYLSSGSKNQVTNSNIDPVTMHHLSQWKNIAPMTGCRPIVNPHINVELSNEKKSHVEIFDKSISNKLIKRHLELGMFENSSNCLDVLI